VERLRLTCPLDRCAGYSLSGREEAKPEKQSTRTDENVSEVGNKVSPTDTFKCTAN